MNERALDAYKMVMFSRAVEFGKRVFPDSVVGLEDAWGLRCNRNKSTRQSTTTLRRTST